MTVMRTWGLVLGLAACGASDADGPDTDVVETDTGVEQETEAADPDVVRACILETWLGQTCTGCHFGGNSLVLTKDPLEVLRTGTQEAHPSEPLLVSGDPEASWVVRKVRARAGLDTLDSDEGDPMPPDRMISESDAERLAAWVESGVPDCP